MEVGFWQILFSVIFLAIMILWRPSEHSKTYAYAIEIGQEDNDDILGKPDTFGDSDTESDDNNKQANFTIGDDHDSTDSDQNQNQHNNQNNQIEDDPEIQL